MMYMEERGAIRVWFLNVDHNARRVLINTLIDLILNLNNTQQFVCKPDFIFGRISSMTLTVKEVETSMKSFLIVFSPILTY